jgi:hypothetical protein
MEIGAAGLRTFRFVARVSLRKQIGALANAAAPIIAIVDYPTTLPADFGMSSRIRVALAMRF